MPIYLLYRNKLDKVFTKNAVKGPIGLRKSNRPLALSCSAQRLIVEAWDFPDLREAAERYLFNPKFELATDMQRDLTQIFASLLCQNNPIHLASPLSLERDSTYQVDIDLSTRQGYN
jgi:hypothetical protein